MARIQRAKTTFDQKTGIIHWTFPLTGGHYDYDLHRLVPHYDDLSPMGQMVLYYGAKQRGGDSYAGAKNDDELDPRHEVMNTFAKIDQGIWSERGESAGPRVTVLAIALANLSVRKETNDPKAKATDEQISAKVDWLDEKAELESVTVKTSDGGERTMSGEEFVKQLKAQAPVKAEIATILAQRASAKAAEARKAAQGVVVELPF